MNKLSYTQISTYTTCGEKYRLRYVERKKSRYVHAALAFGSAIDEGLNTLLKTKDIKEAIKAFDKLWHFQYVHGKMTSLPELNIFRYADSDFDKDLLLPEDLEKICIKSKEIFNDEDGLLVFTTIKKIKEDVGYNGLKEDQVKFYNFVNHLSMYRKGHIMIESYNKKIIPRILAVEAVQHESTMVNVNGSSVVQYLDLVVIWEDGRAILLDNKTSRRKYGLDEASRSQQLISYYWNNKEKFNLEAIGFIVLDKNIIKNKKKTCKSCGALAEEGSRHKTCAVELEPGVKKSRCNGEFHEEINPECYIYEIIDVPTERAQDLVLSTFEQADEGIRNNYFPKNLLACKSGPIECEFIRFCWLGDSSDIFIPNEKIEN